MNYEPHQTETVKRYYQIQYQNIWEPDIWYPSSVVKDEFTSFVEASQKARELTKAEQESDRKVISEYRVIECVKIIKTEVLKNFPVEIPLQY